MKKKLRKYTTAIISSLVAASLLTTTVYAEEGEVSVEPVPEQTVAQAPVPEQTVVTESIPEQTVAPVQEQDTPDYQQPLRTFTAEEQAYIDNYLRELSRQAGGNPVGLMPNEVEALLKKMNEEKNRQSQQPKTTEAQQQSTSDDKNDNLEHSVVEDKEIEKDIYSVKFVTLDKTTNDKKVHDFKNEEKDKEEDRVDYSKEPAKVGTTPGAAYAIVKLEDGVYGQLEADRKTGKKLITVKYDLLKETIEKGSWEYKDEEVVEVKKEDADDKVEETTTTKSR